MRVWLIGLGMALAACQTDAPPESGVPGYVSDGGAAAQEACEARGGTWGPAGLSRASLCVAPTPNSGKSCSKGTDCEGLCLSRSRTCAPVKPLFGCHDILTDSGTQATICID